MSVRWWLRVLTVLGWPALGVIVLSAPPLASPVGLLFILGTVVVPLSTVVLLLPHLLGDYTRTYLLGYVNGCADAHEPERPKLEVVR